MQFKIGDDTNKALVTALQNEFLRCEDAPMNLLHQAQQESCTEKIGDAHPRPTIAMYDSFSISMSFIWVRRQEIRLTSTN
jgi:hypothetical protein